MKKKTVMGFILGLLLTATSVLAGVTVSYVLNKTVETNVNVGETVLYSDGLIVELSEYDPYTLTYFELEETNTQKHYLTYTYTYEVLVEGKSIEVSSVTDNIVVTDFTANEDTITITFSLNQDKTFNEGDILNVQFYFEAVDAGLTLGNYNASNPININTASIEELESIGLSGIDAYNTVQMTKYEKFIDITQWTQSINNTSLEEELQEYIEAGIIIFE